MTASKTKSSIGYSSSKLAIMILNFQIVAKRLACASVFALLFAALLAGCSTPPTGRSSSRSSGTSAAPYSSPISSFTAVSWQALPGWQEDELTQAWPAWLKSCDALRKRSSEVNWREVCTQASNISPRDGQAIRRYFENYFQAYEVRSSSSGVETGLVTGYYEPVMNGSLTRTSAYTVPLYAYPKAWRNAKPSPAPTRAELMSSGALKGQELAWVQDPVAAACLQIQGSGQIRREDGRVVR